MYLSDFCRFLLPYVPVGGRGVGRGGGRGGPGEGEGGARERGIESILVLRGDYP
jgi:hypothetical protein